MRKRVVFVLHFLASSKYITKGNAYLSAKAHDFAPPKSIDTLLILVFSQECSAFSLLLLSNFYSTLLFPYPSAIAATPPLHHSPNVTSFFGNPRLGPRTQSRLRLPRPVRYQAGIQTRVDELSHTPGPCRYRSQGSSLGHSRAFSDNCVLDTRASGPAPLRLCPFQTTRLEPGYAR